MIGHCTNKQVYIYDALEWCTDMGSVAQRKLSPAFKILRRLQREYLTFQQLSHSTSLHSITQ